MRKPGTTLFALGAVLAAGCGQTEVGVDANFATPSGLAVAGTDVKRLFVSNYGEDSLQVLSLTDSLADLNFVAGPAKYFPLRIPAGSGPTDLAVTSPAGASTVSGTVQVQADPQDDRGPVQTAV